MISTETMNYNKATNHLYAEMSDIQLYNAAAVLMVKSHRTGKVVRFVFERSVRDREGELLTLIYKGDNGVRLTVFND